jgi:hypothetical protein
MGRRTLLRIASILTAGHPTTVDTIAPGVTP